MPRHIEAHLTKRTTVGPLKELSWRRQVQTIRRKYGVNLRTYTVWLLHRLNGRFMPLPIPDIRVANPHKLRLVWERAAFARKLRRLSRGGCSNLLVYMGSTTFRGQPLWEPGALV